MPQRNSIEIDITAKDDASGVLKTVGGSLQDLGGGMQQLGSNMTMLGAPFLAFGGVAVAAASKAQDALANLDATLKSTGGAAGVTEQQAVSLADGFQKVTKFSKENTEAGEAMLLTFTNIGKDVFPDATKAMLNLATKMKTDAVGSSIQLGKALNDPIKGITALTRVGVTFTQQQKDQIKAMVEAGNTMGAQKIILAELDKEFGGQATAAGATFSGQLDIMKNRLNDVMVTIGEKLMPIATKFLGWIGDAVTAFTTMSPVLQDIIVGVIAFMGALAVIGPIIGVIGTVIAAVGGILSSALLVPIGLIIGVIAALYLAFQNNFLGIRDFLKPIFDKIGDFFAHFSDNIKLYSSLALMYFQYYITNPLGDFWNTYLKPAFDAFLGWFQTDGLPHINSALNDFKNNVINPVITILSTIWDVIKGELGQFADWITKGGFQEIIKSVGDFKKNTIDPFITAIGDLWKRAQPYLEVFKLGIAAVFNWIKTNVIDPVLHALDDLLTKLINVSNMSQTSQNGGSTGAAVAAQVGSQIGLPSPSGVVPIPPVGGGSSLPTMDSGGHGRAGGAYMIGRGAQPEMFIPSTNGTFIPNADKAMGGSSVTVQSLVINASGAAEGAAAGNAFVGVLDEWQSRGNR